MQRKRAISVGEQTLIDKKKRNSPLVVGFERLKKMLEENKDSREPVVVILDITDEAHEALQKESEAMAEVQIKVIPNGYFASDKKVYLQVSGPAMDFKALFEKVAVRIISFPDLTQDESDLVIATLECNCYQVISFEDPSAKMPAGTMYSRKIPTKTGEYFWKLSFCTLKNMTDALAANDHMRVDERTINSHPNMLVVAIMSQTTTVTDAIKNIEQYAGNKIDRGKGGVIVAYERSGKRKQKTGIQLIVTGKVRKFIMGEMCTRTKLPGSHKEILTFAPPGKRSNLASRVLSSFAANDLIYRIIDSETKQEDENSY